MTTRLVVSERLIVSERVITTVPDVTPDNTWFNNVSGSGATSTNTVTISGLSTGVSIELSVDISNSNIIESWEVVSGAGSALGSTVTGVQNGTQLQINSFAISPPQSGTATVTNTTDGGAFLDNFTVTITA